MGDADFGWIAPGGGPDVTGLSGQRPEFVLPDLSSAWSADPDYPIMLLLGATRFHLGSGTRTSRSPRIRALNLACEIEISPEDGAALDIEDQAPVRVVSSTGAIEAVARLRNGVPPGLAFSAQGADGNRVMQLATLEEYGRRDLPVRIEKA